MRNIGVYLLKRHYVCVCVYIYIYIYTHIYIYIYFMALLVQRHYYSSWWHRYSSLRCTGSSSWWLLLLLSMGSRCTGFGSCDEWTQLPSGICDLLGAVLKPVSLRLADRFVTTGPSGKRSLLLFIFKNTWQKDSYVKGTPSLLIHGKLRKWNFWVPFIHSLGER